MYLYMHVYILGPIQFSMQEIAMYILSRKHLSVCRPVKKLNIYVIKIAHIIEHTMACSK